MTDTRAIEETLAHRPWPLPGVPWVLFQSWQNLLFAHWRLPPEELRPLIPAQLELDVYEGEAWLGVTPFMIRDFRARGLPAIPALSDFPELNLRTYVRANGKPGIHFFSLDAGSKLAAIAARVGFRLPYRTARMEIDEPGAGAGGEIRFRSEREGGEASFRAVYEPVDHSFEARPGSLDHFLMERYALFTVLRDGKVLQADIHHRPWPLQRARGEVGAAGLAAAEGVPLPEAAPLLHFSRRQDTLIWPPMPLDEG